MNKGHIGLAKARELEIRALAGENPAAIHRAIDRLISRPLPVVAQPLGPRPDAFNPDTILFSAAANLPQKTLDRFADRIIGIAGVLAAVKPDLVALDHLVSHQIAAGTAAFERHAIIMAKAFNHTIEGVMAGIKNGMMSSSVIKTTETNGPKFIEQIDTRNLQTGQAVNVGLAPTATIRAHAESHRGAGISFRGPQPIIHSDAHGVDVWGGPGPGMVAASSTSVETEVTLGGGVTVSIRS